MEFLLETLLWVCAFFHCLVLGILSLALLQYKVNEIPNPVSISVIVCAHNEKPNLVELIPLLLKQNYENAEFLIVLDRCDDGSEKLKEKYHNSKLQFIEISHKPDGMNAKKYALEQGIKKAQNEWILLTDADARPSTNWIKSMASQMRKGKNIVLGQSPYQKKSGLLNAMIQYETFLTSLHFLGMGILNKAYMGVGRNLAYRKALFEKVNGFKNIATIVGGDDDLLIQKMANKGQVAVALNRNTWVKSIPKTDWKSYVKQKTRHFSVAKKYTLPSKIWEVLRWTLHLGFWILIFTNFYYQWQFSFLILIWVILTKYLLFHALSKKICLNFNQFCLPFLDVIYIILYPALSLKAFCTKKIEWK